ncbi:MAG: hypothetical protein H5T34_01045 [Candidatus Methanomethyliales bacterium]|nr:hypothetical protein [Candidatus Methanomethylicales archaeon]
MVYHLNPNTDNIREARSIIIIKELLNKGAFIHAHDPKSIENMQKIFPNITYVDKPAKIDRHKRRNNHYHRMVRI